MKYRVVRNIKGLGWITDSPTDIEAWASIVGYTIEGYNTNHRQRAELQGQPIISELCGPMWDGDAVRYENHEAYERLSA